jgi:hypothetical protein
MDFLFLDWGTNTMLDQDNLPIIQSGYIQLNKNIAKVFGNNTAIWFGDINSKWKYFKDHDMLDEEGYFYNTQENIEEDTNLTPYQQREVIKVLQEHKIIKIKRVGLPAKNYYKINYHILNEYLKEPSISRSKKTLYLDIKNFNINNNKTNKNKYINLSIDKSIDKLDDSEESSYPIAEIKKIREPLAYTKEDLIREEYREKALERKRESLRISKDNKHKWQSLSKTSKACIEIFNTWNKLKCGVTHKTNTKGSERIYWLIDNKYLKEYHKSIIIECIEAYAEMVRNPKEYTVPKNKMDLYTFFEGNSFSKQKGLFLSINKLGIKGFLRFGPNIEEEKLAAKLKDTYTKRVLGENQIEYTRKQEKDFLLGAIQLKKYMEGKRLDKYYEGGARESHYINGLFKCLARKFGIADLGTGNISSKYTYQDLFPKWISYAYELGKE